MLGYIKTIHFAYYDIHVFIDEYNLTKLQVCNKLQNRIIEFDSVITGEEIEDIIEDLSDCIKENIEIEKLRYFNLVYVTTF